MPQHSGQLGTERKCHSANTQNKKEKEKEAHIYSYARHCHICYFIESTRIYRGTQQVAIFNPHFLLSFVDEKMKVQKVEESVQGPSASQGQGH